MKPILKAVSILALGKLLFAVQDVIIKEMSGGYPVHQIISIRGLAAIPVMLILVYSLKDLAVLRVHHPGPHLVRGALMFLAFITFYTALSEISLTTATALFFTAPFFITLLSIPVLGEQVGIKRFSGIAVGFIGVVVVLRPNTESFKLIALLPVFSALCYAFCQLMVRAKQMTAPPAVMSLYASVAMLVLGSICGIIFSSIEPSVESAISAQFLLRAWSMPDQADLLLLLATGITSGLGFMLSSQSYQLEQASRMAPFEYVMLIWVTLLSFLVWHEVPDRQTFIGIILIIVSGLYVLRRERDNDPVPIR